MAFKVGIDFLIEVLVVQLAPFFPLVATSTFSKFSILGSAKGCTMYVSSRLQCDGGAVVKVWIGEWVNIATLLYIISFISSSNLGELSLALYVTT